MTLVVAAGLAVSACSSATTPGTAYQSSPSASAATAQPAAPAQATVPTPVASSTPAATATATASAPASASPEAGSSSSLPTANPVDSASVSQLQAELTASRNRTAAHCGNSSGRVLLTFDDWAYGDPYRATRIGKYLQSKGIRAAFFLIEEFVQRNPDIVDTLRSQGHWVLNHSYDHPNLTTLSAAGIKSQITRGIHTNVLRPPYGAHNGLVDAVAMSLGYRICTWTIDSFDWQQPVGKHYRSVASIRSIVKSAPASDKRSGVILGHLFSNWVAAIPGVIADLHAQGYRFCRNTGPVGRTAPLPLTC